MNEYLLVALFWGIGGFVNGIAGFGAALIAMPLVTCYIDLAVAVPSCTLIALAMNTQMGLTYREHADWPRLRPLIWGALPGAIAGVTLLQKVPGHILKAAMGIFLMGYALWGLFFESAGRRTISWRWGYLAGFCSTAIGTAFGMGGPPTIVYTALAGWSKDAIKAGIGSFFMCAGLIMIAVQVAGGLQTRQSFALFLAAGPAVTLGGRLGVSASRYIGEFAYRKVLFGLLLAMGGTILIRASLVILA